MNTRIKNTSASLLIIVSTGLSSVSCAKEEDKQTVISDPIAHGKKAHETHCYKCHSDEIYTREDRIVKSLDALSRQVDRCKDGTGTPWFDEDAEAVVQFLNKKYYRF